MRASDEGSVRKRNGFRVGFCLVVGQIPHLGGGVWCGVVGGAEGEHCTCGNGLAGMSSMYMALRRR